MEQSTIDRGEALPPSIVPKGIASATLIAGNRPKAIVPTDLEQIWRLATIIMKANMAPKDFNNAEKITVALMHGLEIGLPPMMALQRIAVINNRPAIWGDAVPALALATGQVEDWEERIDGDGDNMVATCRVKRKGVRTPTERSFSVADAKKARLWDTRERVMRKSKDGGTYETYNDSPWYKYPKRMLQMRARVAFRDLFADAMGGLYIAEEVINGDEAEPIDVTPAKTNGKPKPGDIDYVNLSIPAANEAKARRAAAHKVTSQEQYDKLEPAGVTPLTMSQEAAVALAEAGDYAAKLEPMVTGKPLPPTISRKVTQPTTPAVPAPKLEQDDDGLDIPIGLRRAPVAGLMVDAKKFKIWLNDRFTELQTLAEIRAIWSDLVVPRLRDASDDVHADLMEILEFHERRVMG